MTSGKEINKYIYIMTFLIITSIALFSYRLYDSYNTNIELYNKTNDILVSNRESYLKGIMDDSVEYNNTLLNKISENIKFDLYQEYGNDIDRFAEDINNPTKDSELRKILANNINKLNKDDQNNVFIMSMDKLLYIKNASFYNYNNEKEITWDTIKNSHNNKILADKAIDVIRDASEFNKYIFWETSIDNASSNDNNNLEMNIDSILDLCRNYTIEDLKKYELLVPAYINKIGDIFNDSNVTPSGADRTIYKIIVVKRVNLYTILKPHYDRLHKISLDIENIKFIMDSEIRYTTNLLLQSVGFVCILLIVSCVLQRKINNKVKEFENNK